jgi:dTMP kinase
MSGKFIVFEGIDGSGSSTQAKLLYDFLLSKSQKAILTSEPSIGPVGNLIREIHTMRVTVSGDLDTREKLLSYLFAADRHDHLYNSINGIMKQINDGYYVISTRYFLSSFAYHVVSEKDYQTIEFLNKDFPLPDYTFYLDCPVEHSLKRISAGRVPDLNEEESNLKRVTRNYRDAISKYKGAIFMIDALRGQKEISARIINILSENAALSG